MVFIFDSWGLLQSLSHPEKDPWCLHFDTGWETVSSFLLQWSIGMVTLDSGKATQVDLIVQQRILWRLYKDLLWGKKTISIEKKMCTWRRDNMLFQSTSLLRQNTWWSKVSNVCCSSRNTPFPIVQILTDFDWLYFQHVSP